MIVLLQQWHGWSLTTTDCTKKLLQFVAVKWKFHFCFTHSDKLKKWPKTKCYKMVKCAFSWPEAQRTSKRKIFRNWPWKWPIMYHNNVQAMVVQDLILKFSAKLLCGWQALLIGCLKVRHANSDVQQRWTDLCFPYPNPITDSLKIQIVFQSLI